MAHSNRYNDHTLREESIVPTTIRCTQCGSSIELAAGKSQVVCEYCGNTYQVRGSEKGSSIEIPENDRKNLLERALHFEDTADYQEALEFYNTLLRSDDGDWTAWAGKGRCAGLISTLGKPHIREMTEAFRTALKLVPEDKSRSLKTDLGLFLAGICAGFMEVADKGPEFAVYSLVNSERFTLLSPYLKKIRKLTKDSDRELLLTGNYLIYQKCLLDVLAALKDSYTYLNNNMDIIDTMIMICHKELRYSEASKVSKRAERVLKECVAIRKKSDPSYRSPGTQEKFRLTLGCVIFLVASILSAVIWFLVRH